MNSDESRQKDRKIESPKEREMVKRQEYSKKPRNKQSKIIMN